jgi:general stress protein 26
MTHADPQDLLSRFWRDLSDLKTGMLGLATEHEGHAQPMTAHFEGQHGPLWFYAHRQSRIALAVEAQSHPAVFHYMGRTHDLYACIHGEVVMSDDEAAIARFWSDEVARWYPQGRNDPDLALLSFTPTSAEIWLPSDGASPKLFGIGPDREPPRDIHAEVRL